MEMLNSITLFRDFLSTHILFTVGILLVVGYYIGRLAGLVKLPEITGFIIAGLLMGESVTGIVPHHMGQTLSTITEVALGLIALTIGGEFYWVKLKRMGREVVIITLLQLLVTFIVVALGMLLFKMPLPFALLLGAIASATAPAATVAIVQSLRARGKFIDYLYGVVALDDAGCVILFGVIFAFAGSMLSAGGEHLAAGAGIVVLTNSQRSWPLLAQLLSRWAEWAELGALGFGIIIPATRVLWGMILLMFALGGLFLLRRGWQLFTGRAGFVFSAVASGVSGESVASGGDGASEKSSEGIKGRLNPGRLVQLITGSGFIALVIWRASLPYVFETSIFPTAVPWLAGALIFLGTVFLFYGISERREDG